MNIFPKLSNTYGLEFFYENLPIETMYKKKLNKTHDSSFQFSEKDFSFIFEKNQNLFEVHRMLTGIERFYQKLLFTSLLLLNLL